MEGHQFIGKRLICLTEERIQEKLLGVGGRRTPANNDQVAGTSEQEGERSRHQPCRNANFLYLNRLGKNIDSYVGKPLEDFEPAFQNSQTFIAVGRWGRVYRFSMEPSLWMFPPLHKARLIGIRILCHWLFKLTTLLAVITQSVLLLGNWMHPAIDACILLVYLFQAGTKMVSRGFVLHNFSYLRSKWHVIDVIVMLTTMMRICGANGTPLQWLVILKLIVLVDEIFYASEVITRISFGGAIIYCGVMLVIFTTLGMDFFMGTTETRCVKNYRGLNAEGVDWDTFIHDSSNWYRANADSSWYLCSNKTSAEYNRCPEGYTCLDGLGLNFIFIHFNNYLWALFQTVQIFDQDYLEFTYLQLFTATGGNFMVLVYFLATFLFGTYAICVFFYGCIFNEILNYGYCSRKRVGTEADISEDSANRDDCGMVDDNVHDKVRLRRTSHVEGDAESSSPLRTLMTKWTESTIFEVIVTTTIVIDICIVLYLTFEYPWNKTQLAWIIPSSVIFLVYICEMVIKLIALGPRKYFIQGWNIYDFVLLLNFIVNFIVTPGKPSIFLLVLNLMRLMKFTPKSRTLQVILGAYWRILRTLWGFFVYMALFWLFFAAAGVQILRPIYEGDDTVKSGGERYNFQDLGHSMMTVFRAWFGEWVETLWDLMTPKNGHNCLPLCHWPIIYIYVTAAVGAVIIMVIMAAIAKVSMDYARAEERYPLRSVLMEIANFWETKIWLPLRERCRRSCCGNRSIPERFHMTIGSTWVEDTSVQNTSADHQQQSTSSPSNNNDAKSSWLKTIVQWMSITIIVVTFGVTAVVLDVNSTPKMWLVCMDVVFAVYFSGILIYDIYTSNFKQRKVAGSFDVLVLVLAVLRLLFFDKEVPVGYNTVGIGLSGFMIISRLPYIYKTWQGLVEQICSLAQYLLGILLVWSSFAIAGRTLFGYTFYKCIDPESGSHVFLANDHKMNCLKANFTWEDSKMNFNTFDNSLISLSFMAFRNGWLQLANNMLDSKPQIWLKNETSGGHLVPEQSMENFIFVLLFYLLGVLLPCGFMLGQLLHKILHQQTDFGGIYTSSACSEDEGENDDNQLRPEQKFRQILWNVVTSDWFDFIIMAIISLDAFLFIFQGDHLIRFKEIRIGLTVMRLVILVLYAMEMLIKVVALGLQFFKTWWNIMDMIIISLAIADVVLIEFTGIFVTISVVRVFRLLRLFQYKPLLSSCSSLKVFLEAFHKVKGSLLKLLVIEGIVLLSYALIGVALFMGVRPKHEAVPVINFRTFWSSLQMVVWVVSTNGFDAVLMGYIGNEDDCWASSDKENFGLHCGSMSLAAVYMYSLYFISFVVMVNFYVVFIAEVVRSFRNRSALQS